VARIFIVDDHHHIRLQLRHLLESVTAWEVCGEAVNGREAVDKHFSMQPHVTVMDFNMPVLNGLDAARLILQQCPDAAILLLTVFTSSELAHQARRHGIKAFCCKSQIHCIVAAIESLLRGESYFPQWLIASAGN
jgi:DNA-binding NarL/FixJ family response regulator